ncbi:MAG: hypothetical protein ABJA02_02815 [Acidobacteriota bacterium]
MKTIFRSTIATLIFAAILALGAVATFAQDPCADAEGQTKLGDEFRRLYALKDIPNRKLTIDTGKQFVEKYGSCPSTEELSTYLKKTLPILEAKVKEMEDAVVKAALVTRFDNGLKSKNWDDVYASGKELLAKYPDEFRAAELVLGSIGLDENINNKVTKWNDETLRYAKMSLADLEAGKTFKTYGVGAFTYKGQADATAWMNYTIGYILSLDKNSKKEGATYLYKAAQANSDTKNNPVVYQTIGSFYFDDAKKLFDEVNTMIAAQNDKDTPEVKQQKVDAIKAKVGILNGTAERALDAYSRAWSLAPGTPAGKAYRDGLYKTIGDLYKVRFQKADGLDAWVKAVAARPMPDPTTDIAPINDPEPTTTTTSTTTPATVTTPAVAPAAKPATTAKPSPIKPQSSVTGTAKESDSTAAAAKPVAKTVVKKKPTR